MKIRLVVIGRDCSDPLCLAANEYCDRVRHTFPIEVLELKEEPARGGNPPERVKKVEGERLLEKREGRLVALDEGGKSFSSKELAERLQRFLNDGRDLTLVIGGPLGLAPEVLAAADERWSLSKLTLPHRLARLLLSEQLYRAVSILRGEPYHK